MNPAPHTRYLRFPPSLPVLPRWLLALHYARGLVEFPFYWLAAIMLRAHGTAFRWQAFRAGLRLIAVGGNAADAYRCIVAPMDSVRHFEMDFFWRKARSIERGRVLDVSSPRLFTLMLLRGRPPLRADFLNPDEKDLQRTIHLADGLGLSGQCRFFPHRVDALEAAQESYDLVVCMSVLEHIVDDADALRSMWARVAPGGRLLLSVPCAARAVEEYTDLDEYGLLDADDRGFVFWQRYYDDAALAKLFAVVGEPVSREVFGERTPGTYDADVMEKRTRAAYPRWREQYTTARTYACYEKLANLPGIGVVAMEFVKSEVPGSIGRGEAR